jgi:ADP-heptose:LPS heptosyltransferase
MSYKFGIFKIGAMGDVLMTTPFLRQLRRQFPDARIEFHVGAPSAVLLKGQPALDALFTFDPGIFYGKKIFRLLQWASALASHRYDYFFIMDKHLAFVAAARYAAGPRCLGFARSRAHRWLLLHAVPYGEVRHEIHYYLDLLKFFFEPDDNDTALERPSGIVPFAETAARHGLPPAGTFDVWVNSGGIYAGGKGESRRLPAPLFEKMVRRHLAAVPVVLLGSELDAEFYRAALGETRARNLAGMLSVRESAGVMGAARKVFTSDGGAMHLASSVTERVHAFFGPTHPLRLGPLNPGATYSWHDQDIFDDAYGLFGTPPRENFFTKEEFILGDFAAMLKS